MEISMVKMINKITGTEMWVDDERVEEYRAFGHRRTVPTMDELTKEKPTELQKAIRKVASKKKA